MGNFSANVNCHTHKFTLRFFISTVGYYQLEALRNGSKDSWINLPFDRGEAHQTSRLVPLDVLELGLNLSHRVAARSSRNTESENAHTPTSRLDLFVDAVDFVSEFSPKLDAQLDVVSNKNRDYFSGFGAEGVWRTRKTTREQSANVGDIPIKGGYSRKKK